MADTLNEESKVIKTCPECGKSWAGEQWYPCFNFGYNPRGYSYCSQKCAERAEDAEDLSDNFCPREETIKREIKATSKDDTDRLCNLNFVLKLIEKSNTLFRELDKAEQRGFKLEHEKERLLQSYSDLIIKLSKEENIKKDTENKRKDDLEKEQKMFLQSYSDLVIKLNKEEDIKKDIRNKREECENGIVSF